MQFAVDGLVDIAHRAFAEDGLDVIPANGPADPLARRRRGRLGKPGDDATDCRTVVGGGKDRGASFAPACGGGAEGSGDLAGSARFVAPDVAAVPTADPPAEGGSRRLVQGLALGADDAWLGLKGFGAMVRLMRRVWHSGSILESKSAKTAKRRFIEWGAGYPNMNAPHEPPCEANVEAWREFALSYLREQLREMAPITLSHPTIFARSPLEGEGATMVFGFTCDRGTHGTEAHYVVVGRTEANYYASYGLDADEAFSLHLGTRFMLVMGVAQAAEQAGDNYDAVSDARVIADRVAPEMAVEDVRVAATFDVAGQLHSVLQCRLGGDEVYILGRDAPPGFSRRTDLPPHVVYRLHIGSVLRSEADADAARERAG
jgi:hypothetical protein